MGVNQCEGRRCDEIVDKVEERPGASNCLAPRDLHQVVDEGGHPVEEGYHDGLEEDHPDEAWAATVGVNEVDEVTEEEEGEDNDGLFSFSVEEIKIVKNLN